MAGEMEDGVVKRLKLSRLHPQVHIGGSQWLWTVSSLWGWRWGVEPGI